MKVIYSNAEIERYPLAGCDCITCQEARMEGRQEWIEPEINTEATFIEEVLSESKSAKKQASLRKGRLSLWTKKDELRQAEAAKKVSTAVLFLFLFIILTYFGLGVYHGLKN